jgi:hypothetical protein
MLALATIFISLSFLKERERLSNSGSAYRARAALNFWHTIRIFANKLTFRLRAGRFVTFPIAFRFFANRLAFRLRCLTMSNAMRLLANSNAFGAIEHFASFIGTFDFTFWFFAFNIANRIFRFGA